MPVAIPLPGHLQPRECRSHYTAEVRGKRWARFGGPFQVLRRHREPLPVTLCGSKSSCRQLHVPAGPLGQRPSEGGWGWSDRLEQPLAGPTSITRAQLPPNPTIRPGGVMPQWTPPPGQRAEPGGAGAWHCTAPNAHPPPNNTLQPTQGPKGKTPS